jgi:hypothetical protein
MQGTGRVPRELYQYQYLVVPDDILNPKPRAIRYYVVRPFPPFHTTHYSRLE